MASDPNALSVSPNTTPNSGYTTSQDAAVIPYIPDGFKSEEEFLQYVREEFDADAAYDKTNREAALEDLKFVAGDQWDPLVRSDRESKGRPCLTINVLPQFIGQVIGDRRINKTTIKIAPKNNATVDQAETRSGIIKSIEAYSRAERVYDAACEDQVTCGISNFRIDLDYADNDVFEQDIFIRHIPNPLAVIWDRMAVDPTGRDAGHCFVQDIMPRKVYDARWPQHPAPGELGDGLTTTMLAGGWFSKDAVRVTEFWRLIDKRRRIALFMDGKVVDITDMDPAEYQPKLWVDPTTGQPKMRNAIRTYAQMHLVSGNAILAGPYELPLTRLPIIRIEGRIVRVGDDRVRYGLVRFAKDAQRLKNYWRSVSAETLAMAPKAQWIAPVDAVEGREDDFRQAHVSGDPLLVFNKGASVPPERVNPPAIPAAVLQEAQMNQQDIKDTTGLQDASLGVKSNEVSGKAITARQREGDVATVIYHDNLNSGIQEGGDVVNQLIPIAYDTVRTLRVIGADDREKMVTVNDADDPESIDITSGKYDVALITGPSYTTQRMESADAMMNAIQVAPQLMQIAGDLIVKAQDWPGAQEIAERLKKTIPPQLLGQDDPDHPNNAPQDGAAAEQQAQQAQAQQMQAAEITQQLQHAQGVRQLELQEKMANVTKAEADAENAKAQVLSTTAQTRERMAHAQRAEHEAAAAPVRHAHEMRETERLNNAKIEAGRKAAQQKAQPKPKPKGATATQKEATNG